MNKEETVSPFFAFLAYCFLIITFAVVTINMINQVYSGIISLSDLINILLIVALIFSLLRISKLKSDIKELIKRENRK